MSELIRESLKRSEYKNTENSTAFWYISNTCLKCNIKISTLDSNKNCSLY